MDEYRNPPFALTVGIKCDHERSLVSAKGGRSGRGRTAGGLLGNDELAVLALLRVSHDVIDKGIGTGLVEGHLDESALRREEV